MNNTNGEYHDENEERDYFVPPATIEEAEALRSKLLEVNSELLASMAEAPHNSQERKRLGAVHQARIVEIRRLKKWIIDERAKIIREEGRDKNVLEARKAMNNLCNYVNVVERENAELKSKLRKARNKIAALEAASRLPDVPE